MLWRMVIMIVITMTSFFFWRYYRHNTLMILTIATMTIEQRATDRMIVLMLIILLLTANDDCDTCYNTIRLFLIDFYRQHNWCLRRQKYRLQGFCWAVLLLQRQKNAWNMPKVLLLLWWVLVCLTVTTSSQSLTISFVMCGVLYK